MGFQPMGNIYHGRDARATINFSAIAQRSQRLCGKTIFLEPFRQKSPGAVL